MTDSDKRQEQRMGNETADLDYGLIFNLRGQRLTLQRSKFTEVKHQFLAHFSVTSDPLVLEH